MTYRRGMGACPSCGELADGDECGACNAPLTAAAKQRRAAVRVHSAVDAIKAFGATLQDDDMSEDQMAEIHRMFAAADQAAAVPVGLPIAPGDPAKPTK